MRSRNLFLGIVFVAVGVLALLAALNVIDFSWRVALHLWPLLLVFVGIVILPVKDWLKAILLVLTLCGSVLLYRYEATHSWFHWLFTHVF